MNIDEAIKAAADHIERHPESYRYTQGMVMRGSDGGPGGYPSCMLARIGEYAGAQSGTSHLQIAVRLLGYVNGDVDFLRDIAAAGAADYDDAKAIPPALRKYAKKYEGIPVPVRDIFNPAQFQKQFEEVTP